MSTRIQADYFLTVVGNQTQAALHTLMQAVPLELDLPRLWGVVPVSDVTSNTTATQIRRRILCDFGLGTAPITANMLAGDGNSGPVASLSLGGTAGFFAAPPILVFSPPPAPGLSASAVPIMGVTQALVARGGLGYTGAATAKLVGGNLALGGVPATLGAIALGGGGAVASVAIATAGSGYTTWPQIVITDPAATVQAEVFGGLQVVGVTLASPGSEYLAAPTITTTPVFPLNLLPGEVNDAALANWMTGIFQNRLRTPISSFSQYI